MDFNEQDKSIGPAVNQQYGSMTQPICINKLRWSRTSWLLCGALDRLRSADASVTVVKEG